MTLREIFSGSPIPIHRRIMYQRSVQIAALAGTEAPPYGSSAREVLIEPEVIIPERDMWLYRNPEALALFRQELTEAAAGKVTSGEDFSQFADDNERPPDNATSSAAPASRRPSRGRCA